MNEKTEFSNTLVPPRNFTVSSSERLRAIVAGPPAYLLRRRRIEDLEASIVRTIHALESRADAALDLESPPASLRRALASLHVLIEAHNRYYPVEASLPIDLATGHPLDGGKPWAPLALPTLGALAARAIASR